MGGQEEQFRTDKLMHFLQLLEETMKKRKAITSLQNEVNENSPGKFKNMLPMINNIFIRIS